MSNINTAEYWDEVYKEEIQELVRSTNNYDLRWQLDRFEKIVSLIHRSSGKILDVGCGLGNLTRYIKARDPYLDVYGVDFSKVAVDFCNEHIPGHYMVDDASKLLAHPPESFDVVISSETIEHLSNPESHMKSLVSLVQPGGSVIISTPNLDFNGGTVSKEHFHEFTPKELQDLMEECGLKNIVSITPKIWWMCVMGTK